MEYLIWERDEKYIFIWRRELKKEQPNDHITMTS